MSHLTSHHTLPPFPENEKTAPLVSISFAELKADDETASENFFKACKTLGFFYLDFVGSELGETIISEAEDLNKVQKEFFALPNKVKDVHGRPHLHPFYAYRHTETEEKDKNGEPLRNANYNLRKDDILGQCERLACHSIILENQDLFERYPHKFDEDRARRAEHTDFGSLTILFNWLGGLQSGTPDTDEWVYDKPIPGSCIVNRGDAMVKFTAGILRSNIHRVVPAPSTQSHLTRNSLVFFTRPEDSVILKRLEGGLIDAQTQSTEPEAEITSHEWIMKRGTGRLPGIFTSKGFEERVYDAPSHVPVSISIPA